MPLLKYLVAEKAGFAMSADMTKDLRTCCTAVASERWVALETREREKVDLAEMEFTPGEWSRNAADLVCWRRQEAGTIEHVHRVMKDELGVARGTLRRD